MLRLCCYTCLDADRGNRGRSVSDAVEDGSGSGLSLQMSAPAVTPVRSQSASVTPGDGVRSNTSALMQGTHDYAHHSFSILWELV